jgi:hypothetical protein
MSKIGILKLAPTEDQKADLLTKPLANAAFLDSDTCSLVGNLHMA